MLYKKLAKYYDTFYSSKKYEDEVKLIQSVIRKYKIKGKRILEVGCGTGSHTVILKRKGFSIVGLDLNREMLEIARKKVKGVKFVQGNMQNFNLKKEFDIVLCLFSTIHYNTTYAQLEKTLRNFYKHLRKGGLLIFDMGFNKERLKPGYFTAQTAEEDSISIARVGKTIKTSNTQGKIIFAYVLLKGDKPKFFNDIHKIGIFETLKVKKLIQDMGFRVHIYEDYKNKKWTKKSKKYVVFVGMKI